MPRSLLTRLARACAGLAVAAVLAGVPGVAWAPSAQVSIDVPQGKLKSVRLRHLPVGTALAVVVSASGSLGVALVSSKQLEAGGRRARPVFSGALERKMSFKVVIPETSDYYLVLDNRRGTADVSATAAISAQPAARPATPRAPEGTDERAGLTRPAT